MLGRLLQEKKPKDDARETMGLRTSSISLPAPSSKSVACEHTASANLAALLQQINGFIQFGGGSTVRALLAPDWHRPRPCHVG